MVLGGRLARLHFCSVGNGFMQLPHKISDAASMYVCVEASDTLDFLAQYFSMEHLKEG